MAKIAENPHSDLLERIVVMQAYADGKEIEWRYVNQEDWLPCQIISWNWANCEYCVAPPPPPIPDYIDWSHVHSDFKFMARDADGESLLYTDRPVCKGTWWRTNSIEIGISKAEVFASFVRGTVDCADSLIERPRVP